MPIALQVLIAARALDKAAKRVFAPHGLSPAQFNVLHLLSDQKLGMRASDLARALIVDPSNVTGLLKRMSKDGLVNDLENKGDQRQRIVGLTAKGRTIWSKARGDYERGLRKLDAAFKTHERATAEYVLASLVEKSHAL